MSKQLLKSILDQMPEAAAIRERGLPQAQKEFHAGGPGLFKQAIIEPKRKKPGRCGLSRRKTGELAQFLV
ncbi:MAG: hypothetical protein K8R46_02515 [Pirellulales bacterium]|nr:hypothetical protein [Pirellulales bacterium]